MAFRELARDIDSTVFDTLGDCALIEGRTVLGMFSAPWLQPTIGRLNTGLREPHFVMRVSDAPTPEQGQSITIEVDALDGGGDYTITRLEPDGAGLVTLVLRMKA